MRIHGKAYRTIWTEDGGQSVMVIDQTKLPFRFETVRLADKAQAAHAIRSMIVRGAPLIGATAAWGVALAMQVDATDASLAAARAELGETRPTAVNLHWALARVSRVLAPLPASARLEAAR
ncbi:MAG: S-methyl-5-thioribose-1-phosphate isomerase, partial [Bosea sp. (in: a-proteobacteria)]